MHSPFWTHRIGWWEILQESPIFDGKKPWFPVYFPLNQSNDEQFNIINGPQFWMVNSPQVVGSQRVELTAWGPFFVASVRFTGPACNRCQKVWVKQCHKHYHWVIPLFYPHYHCWFIPLGNTIVNGGLWHYHCFTHMKKNSHPRKIIPATCSEFIKTDSMCQDGLG